ncbi:hypothetical protein [Domibacillus iocasae]|uniref:hypothetical protein n=1 Tax=Domibacillus iocasae TaxID=1714016 RepID=UPI00147143AD|nr:hypothetical protein [Domibacillus iocasae]
MATVVQEQSHQRKSAFTAGISLVIMALAAFFPMDLFLEDLSFKMIQMNNLFINKFFTF